MITNTCYVCGVSFTRPHNPQRKYKYCSPSCMGRDKEKQKTHSEKMKGRKAWNKGLKGFQSWMNISGFKSGWNKGMTGIYSEDTLEKNRISHLGKEPANKGSKMTIEQRNKLSKSHTGKVGALSGNWKGGISKINFLIRGSIELKQWRKSVFIRDHFTCQNCKEHRKLNAHHIYNFADYPEKRFDVDNGITLCKTCHNKFHSMFGKSKNNQSQLDEFLRKFGCVASAQEA